MYHVNKRHGHGCISYGYVVVVVVVVVVIISTTTHPACQTVHMSLQLHWVRSTSAKTKGLD